MTKQELIAAFKNKITNSQVLKLTHTNMKTVEFYAMGCYEDQTHHSISGYWISLQTKDIIVHDTLKIKKEDLVNWSAVK